MKRFFGIVLSIAIFATLALAQHSKPKWEKKVSAASRKTEQKLGAATRKSDEKLGAAAGKSRRKVWKYSKKESKGFNKGVHRRLTKKHRYSHHRTARRHAHHRRAVRHHKTSKRS